MGNKKKIRKSYSDEFKANAVKMSLKPGVSVGTVAEELDIPAGYLSIRYVPAKFDTVYVDNFR